jgi:hypothetical protein
VAAPLSDDAGKMEQGGAGSKTSSSNDHATLAGIDVLLESASLCVVNAARRIVRETKVASEPEVPISWFRRLGFTVARIDWKLGHCRRGCTRVCGMRGCRSNYSRPGTCAMPSRQRRSRPTARTRVASRS